jgi:prefoldin subunit 5
VEALENEKAQLDAQVEAMTRELTQKSEEIRRYKAEQTVVLSKVRELMGHPEDVVNKAYL